MAVYGTRMAVFRWLCQDHMRLLNQQTNLVANVWRDQNGCVQVAVFVK